jgi:hypothetical protein
MRGVHTDAPVDPREVNARIRYLDAAVADRDRASHVWMLRPATQREIHGDAATGMLQPGGQGLQQREIHAVRVYPASYRILCGMRREQRERHGIAQRGVQDGTTIAQQVRREAKPVRLVTAFDCQPLRDESTVFQLARRRGKRHRGFGARSGHVHVHAQVTQKVRRKPREETRVVQGQRVGTQPHAHGGVRGSINETGDARLRAVGEEQGVERERLGRLHEARRPTQRPA